MECLDRYKYNLTQLHPDEKKEKNELSRFRTRDVILVLSVVRVNVDLNADSSIIIQ